MKIVNTFIMTTCCRFEDVPMLAGRKVTVVWFYIQTRTATIGMHCVNSAVIPVHGHQTLLER